MIRFSDDFGEEIKHVRMYNDLTIRDAAKLIGISHSYLSQIENKKRSVPGTETIKKIAVAYNTDYYHLLSIAGYKSEAYNTLSFIKDLVNQAPEDFKFEFMKKHDENTRRLIQQREKFNEEKGLNFHFQHPEVSIRFPETFFIKANVHDYLRLMRLRRNISTEDMAEKLGLNEEQYLQMETELTFISPELEQHRLRLGEIFNVEDFKEWIMFVFTETPNENFVHDYDINDVLTEITLKVPSVVKKFDKDGNVFFQHYNEEQLKENFYKLEHILSDERLITYFGRILSKKDKIKIQRILDALFED